MDPEALLEEFLSQINTDNELDRRRAFQNLVLYADMNLDFPEYIRFVTRAAEALGQEKQLAEMSEPRFRTSGKEKINIRYDEEEGCQIIANPEGCLYLTKAFRALALAKEPGAHIRLDYDLPPMIGETYPASLYMEDDDYFRREIENTPGEAGLFPVRDIQPEEIAAFFLTVDWFNALGCLRNKIYRVISWKWYQGQHLVYYKDIRDSISRMVVLTFQREDGQTVEMAVDLDDEEIGFLTKTELYRLTGSDLQDENSRDRT